MMAADQKEGSEEEKDAATHSLFCERISAETCTGGQRRQRRHRPRLVEAIASHFSLHVPSVFHERLLIRGGESFGFKERVRLQS